MSTELKQHSPAAGQKRPAATAGSSKRVDQPHTLGVKTSPDVGAEKPLGAAAEVARDSEAAVEHVRSQAAQLATHLRSQRDSLDKREARLNAHLAQMENEIRTNRLMLRQRDQDLLERQQALQRREEEVGDAVSKTADFQTRHRVLEKRAKQLDELRKTWEKKHAELAQLRKRLDERSEQQLARLRQEWEERHAKLRKQQEELDRKSVEIQEHSKEMDLRRAQLEREQSECKQNPGREQPVGKEIYQLKQQLAARHKQLEQAELALARQVAEVDARRRDLQAKQENLQEQIRNSRQAAAQRRQRVDREIERKHGELRAKVEAFEQRQATLEQLQADVTRMHRESLELRLATEELWARLSATAPPAQLTQMLAQLRSRIAEQYQADHVTIKRRRDEIKSLAAKLADRSQRLTEQRQELKQWAQRRQEEIEEQAARLVAREQELDQQERRHAQLQQTWEDERRGLQAEIRRLLAQLRERQLNAA